MNKGQMKAEQGIMMLAALSVVGMGLAFCTPAAAATVSLVSEQEVYYFEPITEQVRICTEGKQGSGFDLGGALIGGIIGNNLEGESGGGAAGAVIGGLLGGADTPSRCHYETRTTGTRQIYSHTNVTISPTLVVFDSNDTIESSYLIWICYLSCISEC